MIKANELRIGNWVNHKNSNGSFNLAITEIEDKNIGVIYKSGNWSIGYEYVYPIPLTAEIFERCGFELNNGCYWIEKYALLLRPVGGGFGFRYNLLADEKIYKYLHQLQNLYFALTGEEISYEQKALPAL